MKSRTRKVQNQETDTCETDEKLTSEQQTKDAKKKKKKKRKLDLEEESAHTHAVEEKRCKKLKKKKKKKEEEQEQEDQISKGIPDGDVEPEDLTPEEKRRLERKLKKVRSKERKQLLKQQKQQEEEEKPAKVEVKVAEKKALEYLTRWSMTPKLWSFQKTRQTWLLQNIFDTEKLTDSHFETLLLYMEGLRGLARETTLKKAEDIVRSEEQTDAADAVRKRERAKQVAQLLCHA